MTSAYNEIVISTFEDSANAVARLLQAEENTDIRILHLHREVFDGSTVSGVCDLLERDDRKWDTISYINRGERLLEEKSSDDAILSMKRFFGSAFGPAVALKHFRLTTTICLAGAALIADGMRENETIESRDLRWSNFEAGSVTKLCEGLYSNKGLKRLDLSACDLEDYEIAEIVVALRSHPSLESLILAFNNCGIEGGFQLSRLLKSPFCGLCRLDLSFQQRDRGIKLDCQAILNALNNNASLHSLNLTCNRLDDEDAKYIAQALAHNSTLHDLFLARNSFTDVGIKQIATELSVSSGLKKLSLWGNRMTEAGAEALLTAMSMNTEVHSLNLFQQFKTISDKINFLGIFNRVGRRLLHRHPNEVPIGLWPLLLERANTVKLLSLKDSVYNDEASCRAEIIYYSLHSSIIDAVRHY
jgi:hypothetical protein